MLNNGLISLRIRREWVDIAKDPPCNVTAGPMSTDDLYIWTATILGPKGTNAPTARISRPDTPYAGGVFHLNIEFQEDYPYTAPKVSR